MTTGDPQGCHIGWPYSYPTPYFGPRWPMYQPGYYHFTPHQNFCPCCGHRINHNTP